MLSQSDVIEAVRKFFEGRGYKIQPKHRTPKGIDIIGMKSSSQFKIYIKATGGVSSKKDKEFETGFSHKQIRGTHLPRVFYQILSKNKSKVRLGVALPDGDEFHSAVRKIRFAFKKLKVSIFWVDESRRVRKNLYWKL